MICAICMESCLEDNRVTLDNCEHQFCHLCIEKWVKESINRCPLCKKKVHKITKQLTNEEFDVSDKSEINDDSESLNSESSFEEIEICEGCERVFTADELRADNGVYCYECDKMYLHFDCMDVDQIE